MSVAYGPTSSCLPGDLTEEAFSGDLSELGWKGKFKYNDDEVVALRVRRTPFCRRAHRASVLGNHIGVAQEALEKNAGIPDLEVVDPTVPGFAQKAAFLLNRDGVRDLHLLLCRHESE